MRDFLRRNAPVVITAVVVATLMQVGPPVVAATYDAVNSDKVDGKHAVGAGATASSRAGKLVATNADGKLPNSIIAKAPDAAKLDGVGPSGYLSSDPGSVTGEHVQNASLGREELAYDATLPRAFGLVFHDGTLEEDRPFYNLTSSNITSPADTQGIYCIGGLDFYPTTVSVSSAIHFSSPVLVSTSSGNSTACQSVEGTQITVYTHDLTSHNAYDGSFNIQIWGTLS